MAFVAYLLYSTYTPWTMIIILLISAKNIVWCHYRIGYSKNRIVPESSA